MSAKTLLTAVSCITFAVASIPAATLPAITVKPVDPLIKVFREDRVRGDNSSRMEAARGEHATFQVVVPGMPVDMKELRCEVTDFRTADGKTSLPSPQVRYVGYVGASVTARKPGQDQLRMAPTEFPDPLLEGKSVAVSAGANQPCWITVPVPVDAAPGDYKATTTLHARVLGKPTSATLPLSLKVYPAQVKKTRLDVVNWHQLLHRGDQPTPERLSEEWWDLLRTYAADMVAHRQNMARVETLWVIKFGEDVDGNLTFDFSDFDKWVQILLDAGIERISSLQFAWRKGAWHEPYHVETHKAGENNYKGGKSFRGTMVPADSPQAREFYSKWFPAFTAHLKEKGWLDKFVQHVGDEPVKGNAASYNAAAKLVRDFAPDLPIIEACLAEDMVGSIDIWVPTIENLGKKFDFFEKRRSAGDKIWFYTCVQPQGDYVNRFLEQPVLKVRLIPWVNYRYNATGFLHWGYNFWRATPWDDAGDPKGNLPAGDSHIVYPAKDGYGIVSSIRWEAFRDGIEDHELLSQLAEKNPDAAQRLAQRLVLDFDKYVTEVGAFRQTRHELLNALAEK